MRVPLKTRSITILFVLVLTLVCTSCGYHNPYIYHGPEKKIYLATWKNRTNQLQLNAELHQYLVKWFQKSSSLKIVRNRSDADYVLGGEIISIDLPSLAYSNNQSTEVRVRFRSRYILKDIPNDKVLFQVPDQLKTETYKTSSDSAATSSNEQEALESILETLSQEIYTKLLSGLSREEE